jgi:hypothetical protein
MLEGEAPEGTVTMLTCKDHDQARWLAYALGGKPLTAGSLREVNQTFPGAETTEPASPDQRNQSWNATPQRKLLKCMIVAIDRQGARGLAVARKFKELVPNYQTFFERPVTDQAIIQRGDCARRYSNENPATKPEAEDVLAVGADPGRRGQRQRHRPGA